jgi:hypothetical protein
VGFYEYTEREEDYASHTASGQAKPEIQAAFSLKLPGPLTILAGHTDRAFGYLSW